MSMSRPRARNTDPGTSHAAAASVSEHTMTITKERLVMVIWARGPITDYDIESVYRSVWPDQLVSSSGLRTRRAELVADGRVTKTGDLVTLPSGRRADQWVLAVPPNLT